VVGANRYRNPDDDLPADFVARREACYQRLALRQDGQAFIGTLKSEMTEALTRLDRRLPRNGTVRIDPRRVIRLLFRRSMHSPSRRTSRP
jgi:hypothetical protein